MENIKVLENVESFDNIFYLNSCFYNAFFPVVKFLNRNIAPFIVNDLSIYDYYEHKMGVKFGVKHIFVKTLDEIMKEHNINCISRISKNIVVDIMLAIENNKPVIIWVDCYYQPTRKDVYNKEHIQHALLVYGFDKVNSTFTVLEQKDKNSLIYERRVVDAQDILNSYTGYINNFGNYGAKDSFFEYGADGIAGANEYDYKERFIRNIIDRKEIIYDCFNHKDLIINNYRDLVISQELLDKNVEELIHTLNIIVNTKNNEKFRISKIFGEQNELIDILNIIIDKWKYIRYQNAKYLYSHEYDKSKIHDTVCKIVEVLAHEYDYYEMIINRRMDNYYRSH